MKGDFPLRVFTFTTPLERSPYSTDGTPVTISTLSISEALTVRVEEPVVSPVSALLSRRMPSTSTAVPNEALPFSVVPLRSAMRGSDMRVELTVFPPGSNVVMSLTLSNCWLSRVVRSMTYEVVASSVFRFATMVTSLSFRFSSLSRSVRLVTLRVMVIGQLRFWKPRHCTVRVILPIGTFFTVNLPSSSVMAHRPLSGNRMEANSTGSDVASSTTQPASVAYCAFAQHTMHSINIIIVKCWFMLVLSESVKGVRHACYPCLLFVCKIRQIKKGGQYYKIRIFAARIFVIFRYPTGCFHSSLRRGYLHQMSIKSHENALLPTPSSIVGNLNAG